MEDLVYEIKCYDDEYEESYYNTSYDDDEEDDSILNDNNFLWGEDEDNYVYNDSVYDYEV